MAGSAAIQRCIEAHMRRACPANTETSLALPRSPAELMFHLNPARKLRNGGKPPIVNAGGLGLRFELRRLQHKAGAKAQCGLDRPAKIGFNPDVECVARISRRDQSVRKQL